MTIKELREKRAKALADARALSDKALAESRELTTEENTSYTAAIAEYDRIHAQVSREESLLAAEARHAQPVGGQAPSPTAPADTVEFREQDMPKSWLRSTSADGIRDLMRGNHRASAAATREHRDAFRRFISSTESRDLNVQSDTAGGYIHTPPQLVAQIIKAVDDVAFVRGMATVIPIPGTDTLGAPSLDADPADADWTSELLTGNEDSTMAFGKRELKTTPLAKRLKISKKLIRQGVINAEAFAVSRLAYKFGISQEKAHLTGTGANQPLGVFTASASGISTSRDVSTDNTTTAFTVDGLKNAKYSLKAGYLAKAAWIFHRDAVKMLAKLKDGDGRYLWEDSIKEGEQPRLLGAPVYMSEYAPSTFTTGLYVGIIGDFSYYWIADSMAMEMQRLIELYAATNQIGLIGRLESDGMPVLESAFARVKLA